MTTAAEALKRIETAAEADAPPPPLFPVAPPAAEPVAAEPVAVEPFADSAGDAAMEESAAAVPAETPAPPTTPETAEAAAAETPAPETAAAGDPLDDNAVDGLAAASVEESVVGREPEVQAAVEREAEPEVEVEEAPPRAAGPLFLVPSSPPAEAEPPPALPAMATPSAARVRAAANPLLAAAGPVMAQARRLSEMDEPPADPAALGFELSRLLAEFEVSATAAGLPAGAVQVGRFALAATLDDLLRARPWAGECLWLRQGLAASGPERFFDLMRAMLKTPPRHRLALELFYACLSLGFEGRFRDRTQGGHEL